MDYLLKASGLVTILFLFYFIFLRNETFFKSIRSYFLIGLVIVLSIPLVEIPVYVEQVASQLESIGYSTENIASPLAEGKSIDWVEIMSTIYFLGVLLFSLKFFIQLISLGVLLSKHQLTKRNNQYFVETDKNISPFSFFNIIIYNKSQFSLDELEQIVNHEKVHAKQWHTLDTILSHLLVIVLWFNPFVWLFKKAVQQNLEFLADSQALELTENQQLYQFTLLKTCTNNYCAQLTNNFYNSFIKKRILMLQKNRSTGKNQWKYALILPLIAAFVFIFNTKTIAQEVAITEIHEIDVQDGFVQIITKDFTKDELSDLKQQFKSNGIQFSFSNLKYNDKDEIIKLTVKISNKNGKASGTWQRENQAIPNIKVGTMNGNVIASSSHKNSDEKHFSYTIHSSDSVSPVINGRKIAFDYKFHDHMMPFQKSTKKLKLLK